MTRRLTISVGTEYDVVRVELQHTLLEYLRGAYLKRVRTFQAATRRRLPMSFDRLLYLKNFWIQAETRGTHTVVFIYAMDGDKCVAGVGFAKRSFDAPRIERGTAIALDRAMDDLIRALALKMYEAPDPGSNS